MASKKSPKPTAETGPVVLEAFWVLNEEDLSKVYLLVAGPSSKYSETRIYQGLSTVERSAGTVQPVFLHSIFAGLVPLLSLPPGRSQPLQHPPSPPSTKLHRHPFHIHLLLRSFPGRESIRDTLPPLLQLAELGARRDIRERFLPSGARHDRESHPHDSVEEGGGLPPVMGAGRYLPP